MSTPLTSPPSSPLASPGTTAVAPVPTAAARPGRPPLRPVPWTRLLVVELRKTFDTRSGFWLLAGIAITSVLATAAVIVFAPQDDLTYGSFGTAVGVPVALILPVVAILAVTSEWSQRSGLTTFTLVPHRARVVRAKLVVTVGIGVVSMLVAFAVGALGNLLGAAVHGLDPVWDVTLADLALILLGNVLGMLVGFMLGVVVRGSAGAIVAYFVYAFVLPALSLLLAANASWFADVQAWVDFNIAQTPLFEGGGMTGEAWAQLGVSGAFWLALPLAAGMWLVTRSEVS